MTTVTIILKLKQVGSKKSFYAIQYKFQFQSLEVVTLLWKNQKSLKCQRLVLSCLQNSNHRKIGWFRYFFFQKGLKLFLFIDCLKGSSFFSQIVILDSWTSLLEVSVWAKLRRQFLPRGAIVKICENFNSWCPTTYITRK